MMLAYLLHLCVRRLVLVGELCLGFKPAETGFIWDIVSLLESSKLNRDGSSGRIGDAVIFYYKPVEVKDDLDETLTSLRRRYDPHDNLEITVTEAQPSWPGINK